MTNRFTELKNNAYQSSQVIGAQLQSVESSLLGAIIAILISALISTLLNERLGLLFWIPASFLSMWLVSMFSFIKSSLFLLRLLLLILLSPLILILTVLSLIIPLGLIQRLLSSIMLKLLTRLLRSSKTEQNGNVQTAGLLSDAKKLSLTTSLKNATSLFKSISVVFFVSLLSLLLYKIGSIGEGIAFPIGIPIASSVLLILLPILINVVITRLEKTKYELDFTKLGCGSLLLIVGGSLIFSFLAVLVFPILSFIVLQPIYTGGLSYSLSLIVIMLLLAISVLAFMNYFSASLVRKEMGIALLHLSNIQNRIEGLLSNQGSIPDETYQELKEEYAKAKRYNMTTDDSLLINYYSLRPNPNNLSKLNNQ